MTDNYDVVVIGAGSTGENVADRAVRGGLTAVLVESDLVGGDCSYWACMPSKALLRGAEAVAAAHAVRGAREAVSGVVDASATLARRDAFAAHWHDDGQVQWATSHGIDIVRGSARVTGEREVTVTPPSGPLRVLTAGHAVVVCTGSRPALPPIPGLSDAHPWTTKEATSAPRPPASMVVLGGGPAGCELATAWSSLGTHVTLIQSAPRLLHALEPFAGESVAEGLRDERVDVRLGTRASAVQTSGDGSVTVVTDDGEQQADVLVVATGRRPRTEELGLEAFGLDAGRWLPVDDTCRVTDVPGGWLYAAGDVNGRRLTTHQGKYQARACGDVIVARARGAAVDVSPWSPYTATADLYAAPGVVFTRPEVASVGRTEQQARDAGIDIRAVEYDLGTVAGAALYADRYRGRAKAVIDQSTRTIVGATLVGPGVGELLQAFTVAVVGQVPLERLWHAVPSYPTMSEVWLRLLETYGL